MASQSAAEDAEARSAAEDAQDAIDAQILVVQAVWVTADCFRRSWSDRKNREFPGCVPEAEFQEWVTEHMRCLQADGDCRFSANGTVWFPWYPTPQPLVPHSSR